MTWDDNYPGYTIPALTATTSNIVVLTVPFTVTHPDYCGPRRELRDLKRRDERAKWRR